MSDPVRASIASPMAAPDPYVAPREPHVDVDVRCRYCHAKLAEFCARPYRFRCRKCKAVTQSEDAEKVTIVAGAVVGT